MKGRSAVSNLLPLLLSGALLLAVLLLTSVGVMRARQAQQEQALHTVYESIRRAALSCYAIEGRYPDTVEHLVTNYGVSVDSSRYTVHYRIFASNLMPDIEILMK